MFRQDLYVRTALYAATGPEDGRRTDFCDQALNDPAANGLFLTAESGFRLDAAIIMAEPAVSWTAAGLSIGWRKG